MLTLLAYAGAVAAGAVAGYRWLRVAQREHYQPGRVGRLALLWARRPALNLPVWALAAGLALGSWWLPALAFGAAALLAVWPVGLPTRGRSGPLVFTRRLIRLATLAGAALAAALVAAAATGAGPAVVLLLGLLWAPVLDACLALLRPVEARLSARFVHSAKRKLDSVRPTIVAITGSYGKTSTKNYVASLLATRYRVFASPRSFNNLLGLSRAVNEGMAPGTEVFVAEMGTYGPGEIRELCTVFRPTVSAITTIGDAHLERMGSRAVVARAKREILDGAGAAVLNVDAPELRAIAEEEATDRRVIRCSTDPTSGADVIVAAGEDGARVTVDDKPLGSFPIADSAHHINVAIAIGIAIAMDVPASALAEPLRSLPSVDHRATVHRTEAGVTVVDDTYNANPHGAARALATAAGLAGPDGRLWVVTPGMIELGPVQRERNHDLGALVGRTPGAVLVATNRTNRPALLAGHRRHGGESYTFDSRQRATRFVMARVTAGDVILYENDLPDHYP